MGKRVVMIDDYPELRDVAKARLTEAIKEAKIPKSCQIIAFERLVKRQSYVDIAAVVDANRTTVSRRLEASIPEIKRALEHIA